MVGVCLPACISAFVCVCVRVRERERERFCCLAFCGLKHTVDRPVRVLKLCGVDKSMRVFMLCYVDRSMRVLTAL